MTSQTPALSIIIVVYNMLREAPRTLATLSCAYQRGINAEEYEVIVVENGSSERLGRAAVEAMGANFTYLDCGSSALPSPCHAINTAVSAARGEWIGIVIDGARMASPGLLAGARDALLLTDNAVVASLAWHLGPDPQQLSISTGYSAAREDELLANIDWMKDGYELFTISCLAGSSAQGYFEPISESNAVFMNKERYIAVGGYDPAFDLPGGGFANLDFYKRICEAPDATLITLLGEGTFHQVHGGVATNAITGDYVEKAAKQYEHLRGKSFTAPQNAPLFFGRVAPQARQWIR